MDFQLPFSNGSQPLLVKGIVFSVFALNFLLYSVCVMHVTMKTRVMLAGKMVFLNFVSVDEHFRQPLASKNPCLTVIINSHAAWHHFIFNFFYSHDVLVMNDNASRKSENREKLDKNLLFESSVHE